MIKALLYYPLYFIIWLLTLLPLRALYPLSDLIFLLLYHIASYRRKTVFTSLRKSFPEKTEKEIKKIAKTFYHQLTDYFIEWMYGLHMSMDEYSRRMKYKNPEIMEKYFAEGKSVILLMCHYGNWEWQARLTNLSGHTTLAIYKPLQNKYFDRLFLKIRGKFGVIGMPMESTVRTIHKYKESDQPVIILTLADQRPQWTSIQHWGIFLNQDTPIITGPEKIARKYDMPVLFLSMKKIKRGYYEAEFQVISDLPGETAEFEISRKYIKKAEKLIRSNPALWLWTHKRWKYTRRDAKNPVDIDQITPLDHGT